ncbi:MAG: DUF262 domain-containing protein, partial [Bdellovibrionales bacterium]|nr:DUF262 domain-containing protein [Bdellovibrionales bacterium]
TDQRIKQDFRFYNFLRDYIERFAEDNPEFRPNPSQGFSAVMDGQQRLTSLYIGLKGSYATKKPRMWWPKSFDPNAMPIKQLYLNLAEPADAEENEDFRQYIFSFMSSDDMAKLEGAAQLAWFPVGDILWLPQCDEPDEILTSAVLPALKKIDLDANEFARKTLNKLYFAIRVKKIVNFYLETRQEMDRALSIFLRTNHGGTPLGFSDLLMAVTVANWQADARRQIDELVTLLRTGSDFGFSVDRDFVLKCALVLTDSGVRFRVANFTKSQVGRIEANWTEIKNSILTSFRLIRMFGLDDRALRAKNAVIPIAYFILITDRSATILDKNKEKNVRTSIQKWLNMALLHRIFSGHSDSVLTTMREILRK